MNLVRRNNSPLATYRPAMLSDPFERLFENMFDNFLTPFSSYSSLSGSDSDVVFSPRLNVTETDKSFEVEAELPGIEKENIKVAIDHQRVSIEAEAKHESAKKEGEHIVYAERSTRKFARSFSLPAEVDDAGAIAKLENGVLMLTLPKKQPAQAKKLAIQ